MNGFRHSRAGGNPFQLKIPAILLRHLSAVALAMEEGYGAQVAGMTSEGVI